MTDMPYPIINVKTSDGLILHGLLTEPVKPAKTIDIHIHGAGGNFYGNSYFEGLTNRLVDLGIAYLSTNNRGAGVYELEKGSISHGVSLEKFADCLLDIDAWIEFALEKGYENIVLEGHSYGTEKIVYYMNEGRHKDRVKGVILLGFSDNVGAQMKYEQSIGKSYLKKLKSWQARGRMNGSSVTSLVFAGSCLLAPRPTFTVLLTSQLMLSLCHFGEVAISPIFKIFTFLF